MALDHAGDFTMEAKKRYYRKRVDFFDLLQKMKLWPSSGGDRHALRREILGQKLQEQSGRPVAPQQVVCQTLRAMPGSRLEAREIRRDVLQTRMGLHACRGPHGRKTI
jgi:hypothetical protein